MKRKSIDTNKIDTGIKKEEHIYIITERKPYTVEDYLPSYNFAYEGIELSEEANDMAKSLITFIKANEELVLQEYNNSNQEAVIEGFQRAVAVAELFIKSLYLETPQEVDVND